MLIFGYNYISLCFIFFQKPIISINCATSLRAFFDSVHISFLHHFIC
nr:MAG TPA: hypothetical protein [Caudoviricetes sp.]